MALAVTVRFNFLDSRGKASFTEVNVPSTFSIAQYVEFAQSMGQLIANLSNCQLTSASVNISLNISGAIIKATASAFSDIAEKAHYMYATALAGFRKLLKIPTRDELEEVAGSDDMNTALPDQAAFVAMVENGIVVAGGTVDFVDGYSNDLTSLTFARTVLRTTLT